MLMKLLKKSINVIERCIVYKYLNSRQTKAFNLYEKRVPILFRIIALTTISEQYEQNNLILGISLHVLNMCFYPRIKVECFCFLTLSLSTRNCGDFVKSIKFLKTAINPI